jgi:AcrR family transcriptional regulator
MRSDARRNYDRILAAADTAIARHGANASLEEIARQAGVGSATLHRHFPSRRALLEAVFHERVEALCAQANELAGHAESALVVWLRAVGAYVAATRGLAASLLGGARDSAPSQGDTCYAMLSHAGNELLRRAVDAGTVRPRVSIDDLLALVNAISLATEHAPGGTAEADRLLILAIDGIRPSAPSNRVSQRTTAPSG